MTQTRAPQTDYSPAPPRSGWLKYAIAGIVIASVIAGLLILRTRDTDPPPTPQPIPPAASTTTAPTQEQQDTIATELVYRKFLANYQGAFHSLDINKIDSSLVAPPALESIRANFESLDPKSLASDGGRAEYRVDIRRIVGVPSTSPKFTLNVCAVRNSRYFDASGKDVSVTPDGKPAPLDTQARWQDTEFTQSGTGWVVSKFVTSTDAGSSC